jgi:hypothetical protein
LRIDTERRGLSDIDGAENASESGETTVRAESPKAYRMLVGGEPQEKKERQAAKLKELADALVAAGYVSLDDQAKALGLSRSTTWTILKAKHKNYGLSAALINRVLDKPDLNWRVRAKILEYVREKSAGSYGHNGNQLRRFVRLIAGSTAADVQDLSIVHLNDWRNALASGDTARK